MSGLSQKEILSLPDAEVISRLGLSDYAQEHNLKTLVDVQMHMEYVGKAPQKAKKSILGMAQYMHPHPMHPYDVSKSKYQISAHHELIAEALQKVLDGEIKNLCLSVPPQFGKTTLAYMFLCKFLAESPWKDIIMAAYNQDFADAYGAEIRTHLESEQFKTMFPEFKLKPGFEAKDNMVTYRNGHLVFVGSNGSATGKPADGILVDDLFKSREDARSATIREQKWGFFVSCLDSRCHNDTWKVVIGTRWDEDDVIARLTDPKNPHYNERVAKQWTVINIPAIVDTPELSEKLGIPMGESLWKERFSKELLETKKALDEENFSALYMGRPTPPGGSFYKSELIYTYESINDLPKKANVYLSGDLAVSDNAKADKSCVGAWYLDHDGVLFLHPDLYWDRKKADESVQNIISMGKTHQAMEAFFEKGVIDRAVGPFLEAEMQEQGVYFPITTFASTKSKGARSISVRGLMRKGKVRFPGFAPWWSAAKEQLLKFTGSGEDLEDDFCDMLGLIGMALEEQINGSKAEETKQESNVIRLNFAWLTRDHKEKVRRKKIESMRQAL